VNPSSCNRMAIGLDVKQLGGLVSVRARNFGVKSNYGIRISAGGGKVDIEGTHVKAGLGFEITRATGVTLSNDLLLAFDDPGVSDHGGISIDNSTNVSITDNVLWHSARRTNSNRTDIYIGPGNRNVLVAGNTLKGLGTGIAIAPGVSGTRVLYNRFNGQIRDISDNGTQTMIRLLQGGSGSDSQ
jgi:hypothetical protein